MKGAEILKKSAILPMMVYLAGLTMLPGVKVQLSTGASKITDLNGKYSFAVSEGNYNISVNLNDIRYYVHSATVSTVGKLEVVCPIEISLKPTGTISGIVKIR